MQVAFCPGFSSGCQNILGRLYMQPSKGNPARREFPDYSDQVYYRLTTFNTLLKTLQPGYIPFHLFYSGERLFSPVCQQAQLMAISLQLPDQVTAHKSGAACHKYFHSDFLPYPKSPFP
jgi:hypothetical protein